MFRLYSHLQVCYIYKNAKNCNSKTSVILAIVILRCETSSFYFIFVGYYLHFVLADPLNYNNNF
jgi:hypothetical protein